MNDKSITPIDDADLLERLLALDPTTGINSMPERFAVGPYTLTIARLELDDKSYTRVDEGGHDPNADPYFFETWVDTRLIHAAVVVRELNYAVGELLDEYQLRSFESPDPQPNETIATVPQREESLLPPLHVAVRITVEE